ncbi:hypothetical protein CVT24_003818, partial [Panaeolus cyanescens]
MCHPRPDFSARKENKKTKPENDQNNTDEVDEDFSEVSEAESDSSDSQSHPGPALDTETLPPLKWYRFTLFSTQSSNTIPMSYETHREQCNDQKKRLGLQHHKVTHGGRSYTATTAIQQGASIDSVRALGNWSIASSWSLYNHSLPVDAIVAAAGFNGKQVNSYFVAREAIVPPASLLLSIFPWIEAEEKAYKHRLIALAKPTNKNAGQDEALCYLLNLLRRLRTVLLQDAAVLYSEHPEAPIFKFSPFNSNDFQQFAASAAQIIRDANEHQRQYLQNLPTNIADNL